MTKRTFAVTAALSLLLAPPAGAGEEEAARVPAPLAREVAARAAEHGVPAAQVLAPIAEASRRGVPADLVTAKVLEGLAKGVPPARIASVARDLADRLAAADSLLGEAQRQRLAPATDRKAALLDLAAALGAGVGRQAVESLVVAAARGGSSDSVVSASQALGDLARRGVQPPEALPLALAIARTGPRVPAEIPALFDAWRAEGGKDVRDFLDEARGRIESGRKLDGMVDVFGKSQSRLVRDREAGDRDRDRGGLIGTDVGKQGADQGLGPAERPDAARGAVPGLDDNVRKQGKGPKPRK